LGQCGAFKADIGVAGSVHIWNSLDLVVFQKGNGHLAEVLEEKLCVRERRCWENKRRVILLYRVALSPIERINWCDILIR